MAFARNVFINCPFDPKYRRILRALLFCVLDLGFEPRIAFERLDSAEARNAKIQELIRESRYGIHDLSRLQAQRVGEFYRLNMPYELGMDVGCRTYGAGLLGEKRCLILEARPFRYQAALSDVAGSDIATHGNKPQRAVTEVRNWLNNQASLNADGPARIWNRFNDFMVANFDALTLRGFSPRDIENIDGAELIAQMRAWIAAHR